MTKEWRAIGRHHCCWRLSRTLHLDRRQPWLQPALHHRVVSLHAAQLRRANRRPLPPASLHAHTAVTGCGANISEAGRLSPGRLAGRWYLSRMLCRHQAQIRRASVPRAGAAVVIAGNNRQQIFACTQGRAASASENRNCKGIRRPFCNPSIIAANARNIYPGNCPPPGRLLFSSSSALPRPPSVAYLLALRSMLCPLRCAFASGLRACMRTGVVMFHY